MLQQSRVLSSNLRCNGDPRIRRRDVSNSDVLTLKAKLHCSITRRGGGRKDDEDGPECPDILIIATRIQTGLKS